MPIRLICSLQKFFPRSHQRALLTAAKQPEIYDVLCIGGGPAGLSLLNALRSNAQTAHLKLALIESQKLDNARTDAPGYSNRCSSLTPASVNFLKSNAAWDGIDSARTQEYHEIKVWDGVSGSSINFDAANATFAPSLEGVLPGQRRSSSLRQGLATMVENNNLTAALAQRVLRDPKIDVLDSSHVRDISLGEETPDHDFRSWPMVSIADSDRKLAARLLVGADGVNSLVRTYAEINSRGWDYDRHGVVATLRLDRGVESHKPVAYQRFLPTGPVAMLPLPDNHVSLVWSTIPERAAKLKSLQPRDFVAMINAAFRLLPVDLDYLHTMSEGQLDEVTWRTEATRTDHHIVPAKVMDVQSGSVASFPLRMRHADTYVGERVALIGDAAHTIHPLAGQGLNQGLGDAQALAQTIAHSLAVGRDIGSSWTLEEYNAIQWPRNNAMLGTVDKLHKLYSASSEPVVWARSIGLDTVDKLGWLKTFFMRQAMGMR